MGITSHVDDKLPFASEGSENMTFQEFKNLYSDFTSKAFATNPAPINIQYDKTDLQIQPQFGFLPSWQYYYKGQFKDAAPNGMGSCINKDFYYTGFFKDGKPDRCGFFLYSSGYIYEGELKEGKKQGVGIQRGSAGQYYQGQWKENLKEGSGFEKHASGSCFQGKYSKGKIISGTLYHYNKKHMKSDKISPSNLLEYLKYHPACEKYFGQFLQSVYDGHGEYEWEDGKKYVGGWCEGRMNGYGEFFWPDGKYYYGEYFKDEKNGKGIMIWNQNKIFQGMFVNGKPHGPGVLILQNGTRYGRWEKGNFIKEIRQQDIKSQIRLSLPMLPSLRETIKYTSQKGKRYFESSELKVALRMTSSFDTDMNSQAPSLKSSLIDQLMLSGLQERNAIIDFDDRLDDVQCTCFNFKEKNSPTIYF